MWPEAQRLIDRAKRVVQWTKLDRELLTDVDWTLFWRPSSAKCMGGHEAISVSSCEYLNSSAPALEFQVSIIERKLARWRPFRPPLFSEKPWSALFHREQCFFQKLRDERGIVGSEEWPLLVWGQSLDPWSMCSLLVFVMNTEAREAESQPGPEEEC